MQERPNPHPPFRADTWLSYFRGEYNLDTDLLTGHTDAIEQTTNALEKIIETAKTFEELKSDLLAFIVERKNFLDDVDKKWTGKNPEQWGFPPVVP